MSHNANVIDATSLPMIVHSDAIDTLSRLALSWMNTLNISTAAPSPTTIWEYQVFSNSDKKMAIGTEQKVLH